MRKVLLDDIKKTSICDAEVMIQKTKLEYHILHLKRNYGNLLTKYESEKLQLLKENKELRKKIEELQQN